MALSARTERLLGIQGLSCARHASLPELTHWLRLTPSLSTTWIVLGTVLASPIVLWAFALVSAFGASQRRHPFDYLYNRGIRRFTGGPELPANPAPRRFAMLLAALWAAAAGALFAVGWSTAGYVCGGLLACAGLLVATTHFCLGSLVYRGIERMLVPSRTRSSKVSGERHPGRR